jgi:hypothetical protein
MQVEDWSRETGALAPFVHTCESVMGGSLDA